MDEDFFLIQKMKLGSEAAMDTFVHKYYADILHYCYRHLYDSGEAEDAAQETFERFFRHLQEYRHYGKAKHYLYVIAGNLCKSRYGTTSAVPLDESIEASGDHAETIAVKTDLSAALQKLPAELRDVLILHYFQDLKLREIADILQIGLPLVKYRLKQAKACMREMLGEEEYP
ncbi:RNA polymerase sigma factor [Butyricicoccus sp.]|uniref:RNA polymerase sigma factor n=1 Tax=Butyricicoccus sp. TaxID=2049021 RepID=UPI003F18E9AE